MTEKSEPCPQLRAGSLGEEGRWQDEGQGAAGESAGSPHGHSSTGMAKPGLKWAWHLPVKALCPAAHGPGYLPRGPWASTPSPLVYSLRKAHHKHPASTCLPHLVHTFRNKNLMRAIQWPVTVPESLTCLILNSTQLSAASVLHERHITCQETWPPFCLPQDRWLC